MEHHSYNNFDEGNHLPSIETKNIYQVDDGTKGVVAGKY